MYGISALLRTLFGEENSSDAWRREMSGLFSQLINAIFPVIVVFIVSCHTERI